MPALSLDHYNIFCKDLDATVRFYERYVGLTNGDRPPFPFPGAWMYAGDKAILHIVSETGRSDQGSGAIDHIAINCSDIRGTLDQIKKDNMPFEVRKVPARPLQPGSLRAAASVAFRSAMPFSWSKALNREKALSHSAWL